MTKVLEIIEKIKVIEKNQEELEQLQFSIHRQIIRYKIWISEAMEYLRKTAKANRFSKLQEKELIIKYENLYSNLLIEEQIINTLSVTDNSGE